MATSILVFQESDSSPNERIRRNAIDAPIELFKRLKRSHVEVIRKEKKRRGIHALSSLLSSSFASCARLSLDGFDASESITLVLRWRMGENVEHLDM